MVTGDNSIVKEIIICLKNVFSLRVPENALTGINFLKILVSYPNLSAI